MSSIRTRYKLPLILLFAVAWLMSYSPWSLQNNQVTAQKMEPQTEQKLHFRFAAMFVESESEVLGASTLEPELPLSDRQAEITSFYAKLKPTVEARRKKRAEINKLVTFLKRQGSPIATPKYAEMIIDLSTAQGADYKVVVAIMGIESGFCIAPYMKYNCFGYLNGIQYDSFEHALSRLVPAVAKYYAKVYGTNFTALAQAYGMINYTYHAPRMSRFYNALT